MARWMILGASSFSGKSFNNYLLDHNEDVVGLSRPFYDLNTRLENIETVVRDYRPDYFVNFAALNMVGESWQHFADYYQTNVISTAKLLDWLRTAGLKKYIHISTPEVYGSTMRFMQEDDLFNPSTPYAVSRAAADMHLMALHRAYGFPVAFTRTVSITFRKYPLGFQRALNR